jgi:hypothetical protein
MMLAAGVAARPARACEFFTGRLRVVHPWTRATAPGAESAVLCMELDEVTQADRLLGVRTPIATGVAMGGPRAGEPLDLALLPGERLALNEDGLHLLLTGLAHPLPVGRKYRLELLFEHAGPIATDLSVDFDLAPAPRSFTPRRFL